MLAKFGADTAENEAHSARKLHCNNFWMSPEQVRGGVDREPAGVLKRVLRRHVRGKAGLRSAKLEISLPSKTFSWAALQTTSSEKLSATVIQFVHQHCSLRRTRRYNKLALRQDEWIAVTHDTVMPDGGSVPDEVIFI